MCFFNKIHLFLQCLLLSSAIAIPVHLLDIPGAPSYDLYVEENGKLVPLNRSDPLHMPPDPHYEGLPIKTQWNEYDEVQHVVQMEQLDIHTYRKHFLAGPSWQDVELSDEDVEDIRQSHFNKSYDPTPYAEMKNKKKLMKRDPFITPGNLFPRCEEETKSYKSVGQVLNVNWHSRGKVHLLTNELCAPVTGTFSVSVAHVSSVGASVSSKDLPAAQKAGKKFLGTFATLALGFIKELGAGFSYSESDSVTYGRSYSGGSKIDHTAVFLCEQPNVIIRKGTSKHFAYLTDDQRCPKWDFETDNWETHSLYDASSADAAVWDQCYTTESCIGYVPTIPYEAYQCPPDAVKTYGPGYEKSAHAV